MADMMQSLHGHKTAEPRHWRRIMVLAEGVCSAIPLMLLLLLLFTLAFAASARADNSTVCTGHNLLPQMEAEQPKLYQSIVDQAAKVENGRTIFWKIEKPGIKPSYLLGTMHVTDPRVLAMPKGAEAAFQQTDTIIVESDEILDDKKAAAALLAHPDLTMFTDGSTLTSHLTPQQAEELDAGLKKRGLSLSAVNKMKPWIISSFVSLPACELARKAKGADFLDKRLAENAAKDGKKVVGLETFAEQLQAMNDLPLKFHLTSLIETLQLGDRMSDIMETMTDLYLKGDVGMIMPMLEAVDPDKGADKENGYAAFEKRIVLDRNRIMAERAAPDLAKGNVFMAVGAMHLPGPDGVVALLEKQGFKLTPL
ncbi:TraB/GumN family protein [Allorhizobium sp. BGMRC 0089]|uniref:TraB/GumN family protein n=1 Tax=Allorhizobium sonneratiae TaxID=2934936 RepID=UPI0020334343|nr:TraB/GumN family protein [Allorhizobium sonneratiae]MCM2293396.1 TraB/GumN family protein [Allorhizobium sonneratiae]